MFNSNQHCGLTVYMRTNCVDEITFSKLYVRFNLSNYNQYCMVENQESLRFEPNKIKEFKFSFLPHDQDVGKDLEVSSISLELGSNVTRVLVIHWKGDCKNGLTYENSTIVSFARLQFPKSDSKNLDVADKPLLNWNSINNIQNTRFQKMSFKIQLAQSF